MPYADPAEQKRAKAESARRRRADRRAENGATAAADDQAPASGVATQVREQSNPPTETEEEAYEREAAQRKRRFEEELVATESDWLHRKQQRDHFERSEEDRRHQHLALRRMKGRHWARLAFTFDDAKGSTLDAPVFVASAAIEYGIKVRFYLHDAEGRGLVASMPINPWRHDLGDVNWQSFVSDLRGEQHLQNIDFDRLWAGALLAALKRHVRVLESILTGEGLASNREARRWMTQAEAAEALTDDERSRQSQEGRFDSFSYGEARRTVGPSRPR